jgi:hypothetical protein
MKLLVFVDLAYDGPHPPRSELVACPRDMIVKGLAHQKFYAIVRNILGTIGPRGVVQINGVQRVIDGSVPTHVDRIPRDAVEITGDLFENILHSQDGYHNWAGRYEAEVMTFVREQRDARAKRDRRVRMHDG